MANPKSREKLLDALRQWGDGLTAKTLGIRGSVRRIIRPGQSSIVIEVTDDQEREVMEYQITVRELDP